MDKKYFAFIAFLLFGFISASAPTISWTIVETLPHDSSSFTEGFFFLNGEFFESAGLYGRSRVFRYNSTNGNVLQRHSMSSQYFGEGLTMFNNRLYQITWKENIAFQYDPDSLEVLNTFSNPHEGWGLTTNGTHILMSTGSSNIYFVDATTFTVVSSIRVTNGGSAVTYINELEYINGKIWANIWLTKKIMIIDPNSGKVDGVLDFSSIRPASGNEMNGIAYDAEGDRIFVTGKNWPTMYHIKL